jgi:hypothetical protein
MGDRTTNDNNPVITKYSITAIFKEKSVKCDNNTPLSSSHNINLTEE